ncbi:MAG: methyltransferase domain-containing protein [Deltaproteobacteria bacterium]|nr:methyltransferase domain-containing protein [Deltaproteobacteria bacterium]MBW2413944.1 methyltransferase domain-containing protein [Deltaproteobacteria bacterium]
MPPPLEDDEREHDERVRGEFTRQAEPFARVIGAADEILERVADAVDARAGDQVLDVCCGPGLVAARLARDAGSVVGVDLTPAMLDLARRRVEDAGLSNASFEAARAEALPFDDATFDVVVSRLAIHHLLDPDPALQEMARVLRPGARLVVADVCTSEDPDEAALHNALEVLRDPSHTRMLPESELLARVRALGRGGEVCARFRQSRRFADWIAITGDAGRGRALHPVLSRLARLGETAGIGLRLEADEPCFDHSWVIVKAEA